MKTAQELVKKSKEIKRKQKITYDDIMEELTTNGTPAVSLTTLRRVLASGSEDRASGFNYESTLLPIYNAVMNLGGKDESPYARENAFLIEGIKQRDSIIQEKEQIIERLVHRLDRKDSIIEQFITDLRQKDQMIQHLMRSNQ